MAATLTVDLNARIAQFETEMKRATGSLDKFGKRGDAVAAGMSRAFGALGTVLSVGALASFAKSGIDAADAMNDMSQRTGVAVKTLAEYKLAAQLADTSLDDLAKGIQRLTLSIGKAELGGKAQAEALQRLGISAKDPKLAFEQLADAVANSNDPTRLAADLAAVLGKSYVNLLPLLQGGAQGLRDSAAASATFAEAMAKLAPDAARFNDQLDLLRNNAAGAAASVLSKLVPSFNEYIAVMREVVKTGSLLDKVRFFALGNASDEIVGRVRKAASAADAAAKKIRSTVTSIKLPDTTVRAPRAIRAVRPVDPLASVLSQTDTAKAAEYEKLQGLLNARFEKGAISGKQYAEALTNLRSSYFSDELKAFNDQLAYNAETEAAVAEHLKATTDELRAQDQAWADAGQTLEQVMKTPLENFEARLEYINELFRRGVIDVETFSRATADAFDNVGKAAEKIGEMDTFAKKAAENIQQSFADFLFDPFDKGMSGMRKSFGQTIQRMIADAVSADLAKYLFGDLVKGGSGSGVAGGLLSGIGKIFGFADGGIAAYGKPVPLPRFAAGGVSNSAAIFGDAGPEAAVPLPDGRSIPVTMKGGGNTIIVNVSGNNNAPDVRRAAGQGAREALGLLSGAQRYA